MEPKAAKFLFQQAKLTVTIADDCQLDFVKFTATRGLFVSGSVTPPLEGVVISLEAEQLPALVTIETDKDGKYSLGPFSRDLKYSVKAEKLGYVITESKAGCGTDFENVWGRSCSKLRLVGKMHQLSTTLGHNPV